ncbi:unnamed protein product [Dovyalis caffra]|uniref:Uncharacterized protein n=1 Tax=Dovyalis caffra TaxID=77055 RepID=A0AAV1SR46_9ROSI|nr:unnamed protein product [Dovyalis caffra]
MARIHCDTKFCRERFHPHCVSPFVLELTSLFAVINSEEEEGMIRTFFGYVNFLGAVAILVAAAVAGMVGGMALLVTLDGAKVGFINPQQQITTPYPIQKNYRSMYWSLFVIPSGNICLRLSTAELAGTPRILAHNMRIVKI